ncbi:MAG TPA: WalW protein [Novosphingobium capsulatum]|nr:polysaccharide deacetylase family protein [Novosphingobium sp. IK01]MDK4805777.1 polysaccharide deacetylase family protein [Novosphingobium aromaticivorans]HIQ16694.1 WalW protein [Novosphingobium capsulatum]
MASPPAPEAHVRFAAGFGPRFVVTVDTEEEFDWSKPFERTGHGLSHVPRLAKFQQFCEGFGVTPVYLIDYPIASDPGISAALGQAVADGRAEIGVQLHPWVNPPHAEDLTVSNSFAGNLEPALEEAKLVKLRDTISRAFNGTAPLIYRAGRYGVGPHTAAILGQASIAIDTSVRAHFDYSSQGGPDFTGLPAHPWWVDRRGGLMELPLTTVFSGLLRRAGPWLFPRLWRVPRLRGVLARLGLMNRVPLTPEGVSAAEAIAGIDLALGDGLPVLVFSFHSPSLRPGNTPYVRDDDQLDQLYGWWRTVFAHLARRGVRPAGVAQIMQAAQI